MSDDVNDAFPKVKNGKALYPKIGERVYVPTVFKPHFIGGRATVTELRGSSLRTKVVLVAEHPGVEHRWADIRGVQFDLWKAFGVNDAREPNADERAAQQAKEAAARAKAEADRATAEAAEREKWEPKQFRVLSGALIEQPVHETHWRGRNWVALVTYDPVTPGGIQRYWFNRAAGTIHAFIVPESLDVDDVVEFGADYIRGSGFRDPFRWYGIVEEVAPGHLTLKPCRDAMEAFRLSSDRKTLKSNPKGAVG